MSTLLTRINFEFIEMISKSHTCIWSDNVASEDFVGGLVGQDFDKAVSVVDGLGARVGHEWEGANLVLGALGLQILLGLANPCDLGVGVDDGGNAVVVDVNI